MIGFLVGFFVCIFIFTLNKRIVRIKKNKMYGFFVIFKNKIYILTEYENDTKMS
jgi:hypothetical protein